MTIDGKALNVTRQPGAVVLELMVSGKLTREDYDGFNAAFENVIADEDEIRIFIVLDDFGGWTPGALWEDLKFDVRHYDDVARIALVGESEWEKTITVLSKPFTKATVKYFDRADETKAYEWVHERPVP